MQKLKAAYPKYVRFSSRLANASGHILPFVVVTMGGLIIGKAVGSSAIKGPLLLILALGIGVAVFRKPHWGLVLLVTLIPTEGVRLLAGSGLSTLPRLAGILLVVSLIPRPHTWRLIKDRKNRAIVIFIIVLFVSLYAATDLQIGLIPLVFRNATIPFVGQVS